MEAMGQARPAFYQQLQDPLIAQSVETVPKGAVEFQKRLGSGIFWRMAKHNPEGLASIGDISHAELWIVLADSPSPYRDRVAVRSELVGVSSSLRPRDPLA